MFEKQLQVVLTCCKPPLNQGYSKHIGVTSIVLAFSFVIFSYPTSGMTAFGEVTGYCINSGSGRHLLKNSDAFLSGKAS